MVTKGTKNANTPWGQSDQALEYAPGIIQYSTPGHGGFYLSPDRNALVPAYFKGQGSFSEQRRSGWYEEDCDWAIVVIVYPEFFNLNSIEAARESLQAWHQGPYEHWLRDQAEKPWKRQEGVAK